MALERIRKKFCFHLLSKLLNKLIKKNGELDHYFFLTNRKLTDNNVALFKLKNNAKLLNYFLQLLLTSKFTKDNLMIKSRGGSQKFVSLADLRGFKIPLPPLEVQKQIVTKIEEESQLVDSNKKLIQLFKQKIDTAIDSIYSSSTTET